MLWGAPLCFILQARPVKIWSKQLFYMCSFPPGVVLSLLPAPQQAILNMDMEKAHAALYAPEEQIATKERAAAPKVEEEEDVEEEEAEEEEVEDESESEQDESDEKDEYDLED
jgi:hypothetical protein